MQTVNVSASLRFLFVLLGSLATAPSWAVDFFVAPDGSSSSACSQRAPCTLERVQSVVRAAAKTQKEDIRVNLSGGTYTLTKTLALVETPKESDSGRNGFQVIWQAAPGAKPVLSGGIALDGWALFDASRNIWRADAPSGFYVHQLYVNGQRAERTTSGDLMAGYTVTDRGFRLQDPVYNKPIDISRFRNLNDVEIVRLFNWQLSRCNVTEATPTDINVHPTCFFNSKSANLGIFIQNAFELLNRPGQWYFDRSGVVGGKPSMYYIPRVGEKAESIKAIVPGVDQLLTVTGASESNPIHDITFKGLGFSYGTWFLERSLAAKVGGYAGLQAGVHLLSKSDFLKQDATAYPLPQTANEVGGFYDPVNLGYTDYLPGVVTVNYANRTRFLDNSFTHLGATALAMVRGIQRSEITGNVFTDISGAAIQLGGVERADHHPCGDVPICNSGRVTQDNSITNNRVANVSQEFLDSPGIFVGYARNTIVSNNELTDLPYTGISLGWGWGWSDKNAFFGWKNPTIAGNNRVVNNKISRFLTRQRDGGAIYTLSAQPGSVIAKNFAADGKNDFAGIYQDEGSAGLTIEDNIVTQVKYSVLINCNRNDVTYDNTYRRNYSDMGALRDGCKKGKNNIEVPHVFTDRFTDPKDWPAEVRAIVDESGLDPKFKKKGSVTSVEFGEP